MIVAALIVGNQFTITTAGNEMFIGLVAAVIVVDWMWRRLPSDHPAVRGPRRGASLVTGTVFGRSGS